MFRKISVLVVGFLILVIACKVPSSDPDPAKDSEPEPATYTVTYDDNNSDDGSVPIDTTEYEEGQIVTVAGNTGNLTRTGYQFTGWNTASDSSGTKYTPGQSFTMGDSEVVLYANWSAFEFLAAAAAEANGWTSVTHGDGLFVAVASSGINRVMTSPDGISWTVRSAAEANLWHSVTYGNGLFVAVSVDGTNRVMTSPDGITWTTRLATEANSWYSVTYGNGLFVAVASNGTNRVMYAEWTP